MAQSKGLEIVKAIAKLGLKSYSKCIENVEFLSAGAGNIKAQFTVGEEHLNPGGTLHGGCTSTLIDCISTYGLMTEEKGIPGVSVHLNVTFLKAAFPGDVILIDSKTIKAGRTLAFLEVEMTRKKDGAIIARGQHTKFVGF